MFISYLGTAAEIGLSFYISVVFYYKHPVEFYKISAFQFVCMKQKTFISRKRQSYITSKIDKNIIQILGVK